MRRLLFLIVSAVLLSLFTVQPVTSAPSGAEVVFYPGANVRFENLSVDNGLSQNDVRALLQDHQGYLWIGTQDGLNRYDGYTFTRFKNDPDNPYSISFNSIIALFEDTSGYLWIGTWGGGLDRYDPDSGMFTHYLPDANNPSSLSNPVVTSIVQGEGGRLWIGTLGGLDLLDPSTGQFTHFRSDASDPSTLSSDAISVITPAEDGMLWIGTGAFGIAGNGLNRFDPATGKVGRIQPRGLCLQASSISAIVADQFGGLWVGHGGSGLPGEGLDYYAYKTGSCQHYDMGNTNGQLTNNNVTSLLIDHDNRLWITTWGGGLLHLEPGMMGGFASLRHDPANPDSLASDSVSALLQDRSGVLWIGTYDLGLSKLDLESLQFRTYQNDPADPTSLASNHVSAFAETSDGSIWIGTSEAGLDRFDPVTGRFTHYRNVPSDSSSLSSNRIMSLYADPDGSLWVGTANAGLNHFNPTTGKFQRYRHDSANPASLFDDEVTYITRDGEGSLWVATMGGLSRLDADSENFVNYSGLAGAPVTLFADGGDLWIGMWGGGVSKLSLALPGILPPDRTRLTTQFTLLHDASTPNSLSENSVWTIYKSWDGFFWFGTTSGLDRYNPRTGEFKNYTDRDGLPNGTVLGILEDSIGYLWITTTNGLVRFDPLAESFHIYGRNDGLQGDEFNPNAYFLSKTSGNIYVGGLNGFTVFNPLTITSNTTPPSVVITGLEVLGEPYPFDPQDNAVLKLDYKQNSISIDFAALDFHSPAKNTYSYLLDGFDDNWVQAGTSHNASYSGLSPGVYTFRLRAANSDGAWNQAEATLRIQIVPPIWQRWQFQVGLALGLVSLVIAGFQVRLIASRNNASHLEQRVADRTRELNQANELLREKAAQDAVTAERNRLARELHDAVTQTLFSATLIAEVLPDLWRKDLTEGRRRLEELRQLTRGALAEMRTLLVELRPNALVEVPLPTLLRQLTEAVAGQARIQILCDCAGECRLPADAQISLYRIAQEALNNVVKHAKASQVVVTLRIDDCVRLTIADNGIGFDSSAVDPDHMGLRIMRERAEAFGAKFYLESEPGEGTQISIVWQQ